MTQPPTPPRPRKAPEFDAAGVEVAAVAGGVTNGLVGAWGPVVTPFLLHRGLPPRYAIGSVNTAEVAVAIVSAGTLITSLGRGGLELGIVLAMLIGGVVAAPLAAYVVRFVPARLLGLAVAGLLLLTQSRELATAYDFPGSRWLVYLSIPVLVLLAALAAPPRPPVPPGEGRSEARAAAAHGPPADPPVVPFATVAWCRRTSAVGMPTARYTAM